MKKIDRSFQVRGKDIRLQELADVHAFHGEQSAENPTAPPANIAQFIPEEAAPQLHAFQDAGWNFQTNDAVVKDGADSFAKVYLKSNGRMVLGTNRLSVRVSPQLSEQEARDLLERQGYTIREQLKFAPNLFIVSAPAGQDAVETASHLAALPRIEFAEPEFVEQILGRQ